MIPLDSITMLCFGLSLFIWHFIFLSLFSQYCFHLWNLKVYGFIGFLIIFISPIRNPGRQNTIMNSKGYALIRLYFCNAAKRNITDKIYVRKKMWYLSDIANLKFIIFIFNKGKLCKYLFQFLLKLIKLVKSIFCFHFFFVWDRIFYAW